MLLVTLRYNINKCPDENIKDEPNKHIKVTGQVCKQLPIRQVVKSPEIIHIFGIQKNFYILQNIIQCNFNVRNGESVDSSWVAFIRQTLDLKVDIKDSLIADHNEEYIFLYDFFFFWGTFYSEDSQSHNISIDNMKSKFALVLLLFDTHNITKILPWTHLSPIIIQNTYF